MEGAVPAIMFGYPVQAKSIFHQLRRSPTVRAGSSCILAWRGTGANSRELQDSIPRLNVPRIFPAKLATYPNCSTAIHNQRRLTFDRISDHNMASCSHLLG